jgi:dihydropyrimidine dehydrogenase (NAD+) subunit PreA
VPLPIFGVGGITGGLDAIEMVMAGAAAVQVCTAAILKGPRVFGRIVSEMDIWLEEHGHTSLDAIQGLTLKRWGERQPRTTAVPPSLDLDACTGCRLCETSCMYDAIHVIDNKAVLDEERCAGCGLCVTRCRPGALRIAR